MNYIIELNLATTKIFPITATTGKAIAYIAKAEKTDNGRLISTYMCSRDPDKAAKEFAEVTATGTGRSTVLAQHFIMAFKPGEVTPERAMEIGKEMCEKYLKDQYQYFLAVHTDKGHVHLHCIFNNTNLINGLTFETLENRRYTEKDRSYNKLRTLADEGASGTISPLSSVPKWARGKAVGDKDKLVPAVTNSTASPPSSCPRFSTIRESSSSLSVNHFQKSFTRFRKGR